MAIFHVSFSILIVITFVLLSLPISSGRKHLHKNKTSRKDIGDYISLPPEPEPSPADPPTASDDLHNSTSEPCVFYVRSFGAVSDGSTDDTQSFREAWRSACAAESSILLVPSDGDFMITSTIFSGPCQPGFVFQVDGVLMPPDGPD